MKLFLLLPDGVGLRNFVYTDFWQQLAFDETVLWHCLPTETFPPELRQLRLPPYDASPWIDVLKIAKTKVELHLNASRFNNPNYLSYWFPPSTKGPKQWVKTMLMHAVAQRHQSVEGSRKLWAQIKNLARQTDYYRQCKADLQREKPAMVFCTHQRIMQAVAPIEAAKDLGIPTASFIFSWDNLPKGSLLVDADYFFVWSEHMKEEMMQYYPYIAPERIVVTGTPQFSPYFDERHLLSKQAFASAHSLHPDKEYVCFSGDDVTTSPHDPVYLEDTILAVRQLNQQGGQQYQVLFRRSPVDTSKRYNAILEKYAGEVVSVNPYWGLGANWSHILPLPTDNALLANTVHHSKVVVNIGSTMALDFAINNKTACYLNYNVGQDLSKWSVEKLYNFVHFRSMDGLDPVYFINSRESFAEVLGQALADKHNKLPDAKRWAAKMAAPPLAQAGQHIAGHLYRLALEHLKK